MIFETLLISHAQEVESAAGFHVIDLTQMYDSLQSDSSISEVSLVGNKLSYKTLDGLNTTIEVTYEGNVQKVKINENGKEDVLNIQENAHELLLNDTTVILENDNNAPTQVPVPYSGGYTLIAITYPNIYAETAIKDLSSSVLYALLYSAMGGIGVGLGIATALISFYQSYQIYSNVIYVRRQSYHDDDWTTLLYSDAYFYNNTYSDNAYIRTENTYTRA